MRILHVLDHSLPVHSGYTFRTRAIVTAQKARGMEVACLTGVRHWRGGGDPETIEGIDFHRTPKPAPAPSPLREWREIKALEARLDALAEAWRPDQLHVHSHVLNALAALAAWHRRRTFPPLRDRAFLGGCGGRHGARARRLGPLPAIRSWKPGRRARRGVPR